MGNSGISIGAIPGVVQVLAGTGLLLGFTLMIMSSVSNQTSGEAKTAIDAFITALSGFATWQNTIVTVVVGVILLGLVAYFGGQKK